MTMSRLARVDWSRGILSSRSRVDRWHPRRVRPTSSSYGGNRIYTAKAYNEQGNEQGKPAHCISEAKNRRYGTTSRTESVLRTSMDKTTSFYKRNLPDSCTAFSSRSGKKVFASALANNGLKSFYSLIQQFSTQTEPAFCGLTTLKIVLNALSVDPQETWKGPWRWFSEEMLDCCCMSIQEVERSGLTLQEFGNLAQCRGLTAHTTCVGGTDEETGLQKFREAVHKACIEETAHEGEEVVDTVLVASYCRKVLGQTGTGHFSPVAAYDPATDQVLILDTARFKYGAHWTKLELLYEAMKPIDSDSGKSRGYALLSSKPSTSVGEALISDTVEVCVVKHLAGQNTAVLGQ